ncbi:MAG: 50S ribosomal protein L4 [Planctomycetes bacterium]|nr:50S ribosomal protein L4 [Planctomycetota bacterium]
MIEVTIYNKSGESVGNINVDESLLGGRVRHSLLKQAIVMYHANKRVGTAATKSRGMVAGSTRKLFKQKGTGNARVGNARTGKRVGGGVTFAKVNRDFSKKMPKKQRRLATDSSVLAKLISNDVVVIDELLFEKPQTKEFSAVLGNLKIDRSCLVMLEEMNKDTYLSARNIPRVSVMPVSELNAGDVCTHKKLLFTKQAFESLLNKKQIIEN